MPFTTVLTLKELNQIALGAPQMTNVNLNVLHTLMGVLLKKLDCAEEQVTIEGFESKMVHDILAGSQIPAIPLRDEHIDLVQPKIEKIQNMEERLQAVTAKLDCHLKAVEEFKFSNEHDFDTELASMVQHTYPTGNEDICTVCDDHCQIACSLINNVGFLNKLMRRICAPVVQGLFHLEDKIEKMRDELDAFIAKVKSEYGKLAVVLGCLREIDQLEELVRRNRSLFMATMEEVQEMMDRKLDKINIPQLKEFIRAKLQRIESELQVIQSQSDCPKAAGIIMQDIRCVSCCSKRVCADIDTERIGPMPSLRVKRAFVRRQPCSCNKLHAYRITRRLLRAHFSGKAPLRSSTNRIIAAKGGPFQCANLTREMEFVTGTDGNYYRKGAQ